MNGRRANTGSERRASSYQVSRGAGLSRKRGTGDTELYLFQKQFPTIKLINIACFGVQTRL